MKYGEHDPGPLEDYEPPFGIQGQGIGMNACASAELLSEPIDWTPGAPRDWLHLDDLSIGRMVALMETELPKLHPSPAIDRTDRMTLSLRMLTYVTQFYAALPWDEAERRWLRDIYTSVLPPRPWRYQMAHLGLLSPPRDELELAERPKYIRTLEADVVSGGLRKVIKGDDLMRRWWSWRRETDEFEGQGSLTIAALALADIGALAEADHSFPRKRD